VIGLTFKGIIGLADGELCLDTRAAQQALHGLIASLTLEGQKRMVWSGAIL